MYTIKRAAEHIGVSAATLRAWESRYGVVTPSRSDGGYRVYSSADLETLGLMAQLVADGSPPALAAQEVRRRASSIEPARTTIDAGDTTRLDEAIVTSAAALDAQRLDVALDEIFARGSFETVVDDHLLPAMRALGEAWANGTVSVAGEHFAAHAVMRRLAAAYEAAAAPVGVARILVGLPPNARHEIGPLAFAIAARRRGLQVYYLGADLPIDNWVDAVRARRPAAVVIAAASTSDAAQSRRVLKAVRSAAPHTILAVGGRAQEQVHIDGAIVLGHRMADAASRMVHELALLSRDKSPDVGGLE
ncbi:MerR family transcriptional regulator [Cumulibacter soli]|uniref:MerR family transcriptional regulator n=1 Tax=Cumulibacter soli TaxID=2546344 RepID=UPI0010685A41|nr:cobalamin B12-binding domain-containing protein [Cumulibacter soli]